MNKKIVYPWVVWLLGGSLFFSEYLGRVAPSIMVPNIMTDFHIDALAVGLLSTAFYYAYVAMQLPVGVMVDRFGSHRLLTITAIICAVGCFIFARTDHYSMAIVGRFIMGLGAAFAFVGTLKLGTIWFQPERFALIAGLTQALGMLGAGLGETVLSFCVSAIGWRHTMALVATLLLSLGILIGLIVRDQPQSNAVIKKSQNKHVDIWQALCTVFKNPQSWFVACYIGLLFAPTAAFAELWGATYLHRVDHISRHGAAIGTSIIFLGWALGSPLIGLFSDYIKQRKRPMYMSSILSFTMLTLILYLPLHTTLLYILLFCYGLSNTAVVIAYAVASEINPKAISGTSMAFANMASVIIGATCQPIIGYLLDLHRSQHTIAVAASTAMSADARYSVADFHYAIIVLPICLAVSLLAAFFIKETHCRSIVD